jgi:catechol 2,3-dioxygenase-like lactoylglutathione lyase family enzyme
LPWKTTYASADPVAARDFVVRYFGAREIPQPHRGGNGTCALIKWVEFPQSSSPPYQMHFVDAFEKRTDANLTLAAFAAYVSALSGNISASKYNQYMDNHVGLRVDSADPYLAGLRADGVPFFTRKQWPTTPGCDVFVLVPGNGLILELKSDVCTNVSEIQGWDFCSEGGAAGAAAAQVAARDLRAAAAAKRRPSGARPGAGGGAVATAAAAAVVATTIAATTMLPWKMTYAVTDPVAAADFCVAHLGATAMDQHVSNDTCAVIRWVKFPNSNVTSGGGVGQEFQLHFVHNPHKIAGSMSLADFERRLVALHGDLRRADDPRRGNADYDQWMDNHVGLRVPDIAPYVEHFRGAGIPFFTRGEWEGGAAAQGGGDYVAELFVEIARSGIIFEFASLGEGPGANATSLTPWDLCATP